MNAPESAFYTAGGTLPLDAPSYIERAADRELLLSLLHGQFCYLLDTRQVGKSSMMVRTAACLREQGVHVVVLDLTRIGQSASPEPWYYSLLLDLGQQLGLRSELRTFWQQEKAQTPLRRWFEALRQVVLSQLEGSLVIFVDEIDAVLNLPFSTDELFAGIRECYTRRAEDAEMNRLTFCLVGSTTPESLIRDTRTTPFNIGRRIELTDFTEMEAAPLADGLSGGGRDGVTLLRRVLYWTGGHPYLTQRLCAEVAEDGTVRGESGVDRLCEGLFFTKKARESEANLAFVGSRVLRSGEDVASLLDLYKKVRATRKGVRDDPASPLYAALKLSGLARAMEGRLRLRNRVYRRAFDGEWIRASMPDAELRRQRVAFRKGVLRTAALLGSLLLIVGWLAFYAFQQTRLARAYLYVSEINLAQRAYERGEYDMVNMLLAKQRPGWLQEDLRGFEWRYLWRLCHDEWRTIRLPEIKINRGPGLGITFDGYHTSSDIGMFTADTSTLVSFSPDGKELAVGRSNKIYVYDVATLSIVALLKGHGSVVLSLAFSPDGKFLASGSDDHTCRIWDMSSKKQIAILDTFKRAVTDITFSPDGKLLATGGYDPIVKLWETARWSEYASFTRLDENGNAFVAFIADGQYFAWTERGGLHLWDRITKTEMPLILPEHWMFPVFSPDTKRLACITIGPKLVLTDITLNGTSRRLPGHLADAVYVVNDHTTDRSGRQITQEGICTHPSFTPDGKWIAVGNTVGGVLLWDVKTGQSLAYLKGNASATSSIAISPDGRMVASGSEEGVVKLWRLPPRQGLPSVLKGHWGGTTNIALSADGRILASGGGDYVLRVWDTHSGNQIADFSIADFRNNDNKGLSDHAIDISPDGSMVIGCGSISTRVRLWYVKSKQLVGELSIPVGKTISSVHFSPDGQSILAGGWDNRTREPLVARWSTGTQRFMGIEKKEPEWNVWPKVEPKGKTCVLEAGFHGGIPRLILAHLVKEQGKTGDQELVVLKGHRSFVRCEAFSADGTVLATGSDDGEIRLWRAASFSEADTQDDGQKNVSMDTTRQ